MRYTHMWMHRRLLAPLLPAALMCCFFASAIFQPPSVSAATLSQPNLPGIDESTLPANSNYRITLTYSYNGVDSTNRRQVGQVALTRLVNRPRGERHLRFVASSPEQRSETQEYFEVDGLPYAASDPPTAGESCWMVIDTQTFQQQVLPIFDPRIYIGSASSATLVSRGEQVNGVRADRYSVSRVRFGSFTSVRGTIWVAQAGGFVVRYEGSASGRTTVVRGELQGDFSWAYNVTLLSQPSTVALPRQCAPLQPDSDLPRPQGAVVRLSSPEAFGYLIANRVSDMAAFYDNLLPRQGWRIDPPSGPIEQGHIFTISKGQRIRTITILPDPQTGGSSVIILKGATAQPANDIPLPANARDVNRIGASLFFNTPDRPAAVIAFYTQQMPRNGWSLTGQQTLNNGVVQLDFAKGPTTARVLVTGRNGGGSAVSINR